MLVYSFHLVIIRSISGLESGTTCELQPLSDQMILQGNLGGSLSKESSRQSKGTIPLNLQDLPWPVESIQVLPVYIYSSRS